MLLLLLLLLLLYGYQSLKMLFRYHINL